MFCCGTEGWGSFHDMADFDVKETEKGVRVDITPKDASKASALKAFVKACQELCHDK
jgi:hydroxymethylpyrimidine pyrophosphatase-like HAD family hydrolase